MPDAPPSPPPGQPKVWFKPLAIFLSTGVGLVAIAALMIHQERLVLSFTPFEFRFQKPPVYLHEQGHEVTGHRYVFDEKLGWRNVPGWKATTFGKPLTISSQGFRDRHYSLAKPPGIKRMLVLGDSFTWGYGVGDQEIFTEVLERELNSRGQEWEVINTGVSGWGTDQEYLFFRNEGRHFEPDFVVLAYYLGNDWGNNVATIQYHLGKPCFTDTNLTRVIPPVLNPGKEYDYNMSLQPVAHSIALVKATHDLCREIDAEFLLLFFGALGVEPGSQTDQFARKFVPAITNVLSERRVDFIDVDMSFVRSGATSQAVFGGNNDGHWNANGHRLVAGFVFRWLQENSDR